MNNPLKKKGFTLIEIMVVIAIIGVLVAIVLAGAGQARSVARDSQRLSDMQSLRLRLEQYRLNSGGYPVTLTALKDAGYITVVPKDPSTNNDYAPSPYTPGPNNCGVSSKCTSYVLRVTLENTNIKANGTTVYELYDPYHTVNGF